MSGYVAYVNVPGYMPMDDEPPHQFSTATDAWEHLLSELDRSDGGWVPTHPEDPEGPYSRSDTALAIEEAARRSVVGTIYGPTPGYDDGDHDLGLAYTVDYTEEDDPYEDD